MTEPGTHYILEIWRDGLHCGYVTKMYEPDRVTYIRTTNKRAAATYQGPFVNLLNAITTIRYKDPTAWTDALKCQIVIKKIDAPHSVE